MAKRARRLSEEDVERLLAERSAKARAATATQVAEDFASGSLNENERRLAIEIFRIMVGDAERRVREALARQLKESPHLPRDLALALAHDVESVAVPILHYSEVLTDQDLIEIVRSRSVPKQVAIASRRKVSPDVSEALVDWGNEDAVATLMGNEGAEIPEEALHAAVTRFGDDERIQERLVHRAYLPVTVAERLVTKVSERLRQHLLKRHHAADHCAATTILHARERVVLGLSEGVTEEDIEALIAQLHENGRLMPSIILRALCQGDIAFFEAAVARLAQVPLPNARKLVHDPGPFGLPAIFARAGLPPHFFPAARAALRMMAELERDGGPGDRKRFARTLMERILTQYDELGVTFETPDLEYLLDRLNAMAA